MEVDSQQKEKVSLVLSRMLLLVVVGGVPLGRFLGNTVSLTINRLPNETQTQGPRRPHTETFNVEETLSGSLFPSIVCSGLTVTLLI